LYGSKLLVGWAELAAAWWSILPDNQHLKYQQLVADHSCPHSNHLTAAERCLRCTQEFGKTKLYIPKQEGLEVLSREVCGPQSSAGTAASAAAAAVVATTELITACRKIRVFNKHAASLALISWVGMTLHALSQYLFRHQQAASNAGTPAWAVQMVAGYELCHDMAPLAALSSCRTLMLKRLS
jgi:hypothetical protein